MLKRRKLKLRKRRKIFIFIIPIGVFIFILLSLYLLNTFTSFSFFKKNFLSPIAINGSLKKGYQILLNKNPSKELEILLLKNKISFSSINQGLDYSYIVKFKDGEEVIFSSKKSLDPQVTSLQFVLSRLTIEGKRFVRLDLRFDKPVITLK